MAFVIDDLIYALVMMVISFAISYAMQPRPERNNAVVVCIDLSTAEAGKTITGVRGTRLSKDSNVIDYFDPKTYPITTSGGGK